LANCLAITGLELHKASGHHPTAAQRLVTIGRDTK